MNLTAPINEYIQLVSSETIMVSTNQRGDWLQPLGFCLFLAATLVILATACGYWWLEHGFQMVDDLRVLVRGFG